MADFLLSPPQPSLAGSTVYARLLASDGAVLAIAAMGVVDALGHASGDVPSGISAGTIVVEVYEQLGGEPAPSSDHLVGWSWLEWAGDEPLPGIFDLFGVPLAAFADYPVENLSEYGDERPELAGHGSTSRPRRGGDRRGSTSRPRSVPYLDAQ